MEIVCQRCGVTFDAPIIGRGAYKGRTRAYCSRSCQGKYKGPLEKRFWAKVNKTDTCWLWTGSLAGGGYGQIVDDDQKRDMVHRVSWRLHFGPIPDGLHACHKCDVRNCVNPEHLFLGTRKDNSQDMLAKGRHFSQTKTHCPNGHVYEGENIYAAKDGSRMCRTCMQSRHAAKLSTARSQRLAQRQVLAILVTLMAAQLPVAIVRRYIDPLRSIRRIRNLSYYLQEHGKPLASLQDTARSETRLAA